MGSVQVHAPEGTFLRQEQDALDWLQALLANGCHLTRPTDQLLRGAVGEGALFGGLEVFEYLDQPSKWLIARQVAGILVK